MMKVAIISLTTLFIFLCGCAGFLARKIYVESQPVRKDLPDLILAVNATDKYPAVVRLHDKKTGEFFCSGTVIGANYIVTAGHCLEGRSKREESVEVRMLDGTKLGVMGTAVFYEGRSDQGLIFGEFTDFNSLPFDEHPFDELKIYAQPDSVMVACGFPYGGEFFCSPLEQRSQNYFSIHGSGYLYPGMSGGPVFDARTQIVIGVNTAVVESGIIISPLVEILAHAGIKRAVN